MTAPTSLVRQEILEIPDSVSQSGQSPDIVEMAHAGLTLTARATSRK